MAKKPNDKENINPIARTENTDTSATDKDKNQTAKISPVAESANGENGNSKPKESGAHSEMDSKTENGGTGGEGHNAQSSPVISDNDPETKNGKLRAKIAGDIFKRGVYSALFFTSDLIAFDSANAALHHADRLADKSIYKILNQ